MIHNIHSRLVIIPVCLILFPVKSATQVFDSTGVVYVVEHSHSDIAWLHTIEDEKATRNNNLKKVFSYMEEDTTFNWTIECVLYFKNWIEDHPDTEDKIISYFRQGRLDCGASYTQPMEDCLYNELLVRQMYSGKRWFEEKYPGIKLDLVMNQDAPLRGLQAQQVYKKSGVKYLKGSRMDTPPFFKWFSPDGSYLFSWFQIGYWGRPDIDSAYIINHLKSIRKNQSGYYDTRGMPAVAAITWGWDYNDPFDFSKVIGEWNANQARYNQPEVMYGTFTDVLKEIDKPGVQFPEIHGTVPNWWVYENWPTHNRLMSLQRDAARLLTSAEIFQTIKALRMNDFSGYPAAELTKGWENISFACHTIVPRAYDTFLDKYEEAYHIADNEMHDALNWLAARVAGNNSASTVVIFNSLSWIRTDPVVVDISTMPTDNVQVVDEDDHIIPSQISSEGKLVFIAGDVPSVGYRTYYLVEKGRSSKRWNPEIGETWDKAFESEYYRITPGNGGLNSIIDKEFNKELLNTEKWSGGEWTSFHTDARGASEYIDFEPKPWKYSERLSDHHPSWKCVESGPVYVAWETDEIAAKHCSVRLRVKIYRTIKRKIRTSQKS